MKIYKKISLVSALLITVEATQAQDTLRYTGTTIVNADYHHGQLVPAVGVHNIQTFRANREHPELADGLNWTYNHAPMLAYWNNTFYLEYLSDPVGEHIPPSRTLLQTSKDGYKWSKPDIIFPPYKIPDGWKKEGVPGVAKDLYATMHQRVGFYVSKADRLYALAYYGIAMDKTDDPNDGKGIGRVIREIKKDGTYGPIYLLRPNSTWDMKHTLYPMYTSSKDKSLVTACIEILASPLMMQQMVEEADRNDPLIPLNRPVKAFSYYHMANGKVVGLWKHALTSVSNDHGKTWQYTPLRAPGVVNSNAKIWGQRTSDGRYAIVYNPSEFRWPLAVSTSDDGLNYKDLLLVNGEISQMRYGGNYKSYGPQYIRGIPETDGKPADGNMWLTYSMNKEDIWVAKVPVPVTAKVSGAVNEVFNSLPDGQELKLWNTFSPLWASVKIEKASDGTKALTLRDKDPYDYAKADRVIPAARKVNVEFSVTPAQNNTGSLQIEFQDAKGTAAARLIFGADGEFTAKVGYRNSGIMKYEAGKVYNIRVELDMNKRMYNIFVNGESKGTRLMFVPVSSFERVVFRTGDVRRYPDVDTPTDQDYDLKDAGTPVKEAVYYIKSLKTAAF
ncbi:BNR repeat-like domain-containing protein [Pedobacter sp. ok626]|uniref:exo-alpha-sialidase n=1 Tax=Pedobacter sp. ok626 TaxID=1761882 RepID=UPI00088DEEDF|nr:exo-alpha-sialidase [Pedobacter sp. ok626]SDJ07892.1 BNR repeat-like domain-containing protein [Pedobacter sp. ok626]